MEEQVVCLDTSILIDFFRKKNKEKSVFFQLTQNYNLFSVSVISAYEIYTGSTREQNVFCTTFFSKVIVLPFDSETNQVAVSIQKELKSKNKLIDIPDIFIAASAIYHQFPIATINQKHFERIDELEIVKI